MSVMLKSSLVLLMVSGFSILGECSPKKPNSTTTTTTTTTTTKSKTDIKPGVPNPKPIFGANPNPKPNHNPIKTKDKTFVPGFKTNPMPGGINKEPSELTDEQRKIYGEIIKDKDKRLVRVKTLGGKKTEYNINLERTIGDLKILFKSKEGVPVECQRMVFKGSQRNDDSSLSKIGVQGDKVDEFIHMVLPLSKK